MCAKGNIQNSQHFLYLVLNITFSQKRYRKEKKKKKKLLECKYYLQNKEVIKYISGYLISVLTINFCMVYLSTPYRLKEDQEIWAFHIFIATISNPLKSLLPLNSYMHFLIFILENNPINFTLICSFYLTFPLSLKCTRCLF